MSTLVFGLVAFGCAQSGRPADGPASHTQTTSGTLSNPSYGTSDLDGWDDPAASGNETHGTATSGPTARPAPLARPDGGA